MMGVPYVLALHEDYLRTCVRLLAGEGLCRAKDVKANLVDLHGIIEITTGYKYSADLIAYIDTLRLMRNCVIHNGGLLSQPLYDQLKSWTPAQELGWEASPFETRGIFGWATASCSVTERCLRRWLSPSGSTAKPISAYGWRCRAAAGRSW
ncbi:hypothetical protein APR09_004093 [Nocardia amikacinitolerans]|nr:hypothetical protein [Nocardia amikacinitolerans]